MIRVSTAAEAELRRRAEAEGRTVVAVVDRLLGHVGALRPHDPGETLARVGDRAGEAMTRALRAAQPVQVTRSAESPPICPRCGCSAAMHRAGVQANRCERHPTCRWTTR